MMNLLYDLRVADDPVIDEAEPWTALVDAQELDSRFRRLPSRLQEARLAAHDRFVAAFAGRPDFYPARVSMEVLERWLQHEARDPLEAASLRGALNALLMKAFDLGYRVKPLVLQAPSSTPKTPTASAGTHTVH